MACLGFFWHDISVPASAHICVIIRVDKKDTSVGNKQDEKGVTEVKITNVSVEYYRWPRSKPISNGKYTYLTVGWLW